MENSKLQFFLGDKLKVIDFEKSAYLPSTTVLNYIRAEGFKGTKEGCAEGDCGACTVVIGTPESGKMIYQAVNSCLIFLASLHGKQLIVIENLMDSSAGKNHLHPVQQALIAHHASQCGFCTPGIAMSLFAQYKAAAKPDTNTLKLQLSGNLCRCTGYESVLNAALASLQNIQPDHFSHSEADLVGALEMVRESGGLRINAAKQKYFLPSSLKEALQLRAEHPAAKIINGNTDNAVRQNKTFIFDREVIDLSAVAAINGIIEKNNSVELGASCSIEKMRLYLVDRIPSLSQLLAYFASAQIRNLATAGGNICTASPIGDLLPALVALNARVELQSKNDSRVLSLEDFILDYRKIDLAPDELLTRIFIPVPAPNQLFLCVKASVRKQLDISTVSLAMLLQKDKANRVEKIVLAYGGMAATVKRAAEAENFLTGKHWAKENIEKCIPLISCSFEPISDARAEAAARTRLSGNLFLRLFNQSLEGGSHEK